MTPKNDETLEVAALEDAAELIDLGNAVEETKQLTPHGIFPDCYYGIGARPGCG